MIFHVSAEIQKSRLMDAALFCMFSPQIFRLQHRLFYFLAFCEMQFLFSLFYRLAVFMICTAAEAFPVIIAEPAAKYSALSNRYALKRSIQFTFYLHLQNSLLRTDYLK